MRKTWNNLVHNVDISLDTGLKSTHSTMYKTTVENLSQDLDKRYVDTLYPVSYFLVPPPIYKDLIQRILVFIHLHLLKTINQT